jgi:hypothetical protein
MKIPTTSSVNPELAMTANRPAGSENINATKAEKKWSELINKITRLTDVPRNNSFNTSYPVTGIDQLSGLIKLQMDLSRYQLKVELLSKVSESAVASIRKLQQNN